MKKISGVLSALLFVMIVAACGDKKKDVSPPPPPPPPATATYQQRLADTLFKLAQQTYYWNTSLTDSGTFKPLGYAASDTLNGLQNELFALTRLAKNPNNNNKPYEQAIDFDQYGNPVDDNTTSKYSYVRKTSDLYNGGATSYAITNQSQIAEMKMTLDGQDNSLGFRVGLIPVSYSSYTYGGTKAKDSIPYKNSDSTVIYVRTVTNGSPAYNAGLRRGDVIANKELDYDTYGITPVQNLLKASSASLILYRPKTKTKDTLATFNKAVYTFNPVLRAVMDTVGSKKIAYIAYQSFTTKTNSQSNLDAAFAKFTGATDIVVDLRENGGGYVDVAEYLINLLAPQSANGSTAFAEYYNQTMVNKQATWLKYQPVYLNNVKQSYSYFDLDYTVAENTTRINKTTGVNTSNNIQNIYFIVSSGTASAAELVINSLKPYYNVVLIGASFSDRGTATYGKPVGFFELRLGQYSVFLSNFETKNALGNGGYYTGMATTYQNFDDVRYNYGDPNETCFLKAIRLITGNAAYLPVSSAHITTNPTTLARALDQGTVIRGISVGARTQVQGMIETPHK